MMATTISGNGVNTGRREFLQLSSGAMAAGIAALPGSLSGCDGPKKADDQGNVPQINKLLPENEGKKPLRLGLIIGIGNDPDAAMKKVSDLGLPSCQAYVDEFHPDLVMRLRQALDKHKIEATSLVVGGPGKEVWDFYQGPLTIGLLPRETRAARMAHIKKASDFAKLAGIPAVQTHCGFIPEDPNVPLYKETVDAMREIATYCKQNGQNFRYETGQETPITLVRAICDVGADNQGINFDFANLIMYGKANPVDAVELLAPYIQGIHAKDGLWPVNPHDLGQEVPIG